jgi:hypothetical protein
MLVHPLVIAHAVRSLCGCYKGSLMMSLCVCVWGLSLGFVVFYYGLPAFQ